jgi:hypothetical protein
MRRRRVTSVIDCVVLALGLSFDTVTVAAEAAAGYVDVSALRKQVRVPGSLCMTLSSVLLGSLLLAASVAYPSDADERAAIVAKLYRDYAWEVVVFEPHFPPFIDQPKEVLEQYLTPEMAALILKDRECLKRTRELCWIESPPLWVGNDPGAQDLTVTAGQGNEVAVRFTYPGSNKNFELRYRVVRIRAKWLIDDILFEGSSLKEHLKKPQ